MGGEFIQSDTLTGVVATEETLTGNMIPEENLQAAIASGGELQGEVTPTESLQAKMTPQSMLEASVQIPKTIEDVEKKLPKISEVTLLAAAWTGEGNKWHSQIAEVKDGTSKSQVDLTPDVQQLEIFYEKDLTFLTENLDGVVTVYAIGQKPLNDYTIQVTLTEVDVPDGTAIWGITVGTPMNPQRIADTVLPTVTENDEGKILTVQGGKWTADADENRPLTNLEIEKIINSSL